MRAHKHTQTTHTNNTHKQHTQTTRAQTRAQKHTQWHTCICAVTVHHITCTVINLHHMSHRHAVMQLCSHMAMPPYSHAYDCTSCSNESSKKDTPPSSQSRCSPPTRIHTHGGGGECGRAGCRSLPEPSSLAASDAASATVPVAGPVGTMSPRCSLSWVLVGPKCGLIHAPGSTTL